MKGEENKYDTFVATQRPLIATEEESGVTDKPFSNAQLALIRQTIKTLEASLVENLRARTRRALADIALGRPEEDDSEGDNLLVDFVRGIVRGNMKSSRSMSKVENAAKDNVLSEEATGRIAEEVSRSDQLMKPFALFVRDQVYHRVLVTLAEERFLHSRKRLPTGEGESVPSRHGIHYEKKDETDMTVDSFDTDEICRDLPVRQIRKEKNGHRRDSSTDDESLPSDQLD